MKKVLLLLPTLMLLLVGCVGNLVMMENDSIIANSYFVEGDFAKAESLTSELVKNRTVHVPLYKLELISIKLLAGKHDEALNVMWSLHNDFESLSTWADPGQTETLWDGRQKRVYRGEVFERSFFYALMAMEFLRRKNYEDAMRCVRIGLQADSYLAGSKVVTDQKKAMLNKHPLLYYLAYLAESGMKQHDAAATAFNKMREAVNAQRAVLSLSELPDSKETYLDNLKIAAPNVLLVIWSGLPPEKYFDLESEQYVIHKGSSFIDSFSGSADGEIPRFFAGNIADIEFTATREDGVEQANLVSGEKNPHDPEKPFFHWRNLPRKLYILPLHLAPGSHRITVTGYSRSDRTALFVTDIKADEKSINVVHLPMFRHGEGVDAVRLEKFSAEKERVLNNASHDRKVYEVKL